MEKAVILLCSLALVRAGIIGTHFSPATSVSSVYSSISNGPVSATAGTQFYGSTDAQIKSSQPAPIYETVASSHESNTKGLDGSQQTTFAKTLDTAYSSIKKYDSRSANNGILAHIAPTVYSSPIHSSYLYSPASYTGTSPISDSISPVTYTTYSTSPTVTKYSTPVVTKTFTPATAYTSHGDESVIRYSEAPLVSHMSFTGLGTTYAW